MFVVELAGLQAVVELAEELVEQVSWGLVVPVSGGAAGVEVAARAGRGAQRCQGPDRPDRGEAPILDMAGPSRSRPGSTRRSMAWATPARSSTFSWCAAPGVTFPGPMDATCGGKRRSRQRRPSTPRRRSIPSTPVSAIHLGHHRQAQGHHAHLGWIPHPGVLHPSHRVRHQARDRHLLVHRRYRLGHRAHLHRLRAAVQWGHPGGL
ncbi:MAG: hypothetical protein QOF66_6630 [Mycobacterium sp.]|jgi:hypothetical protein|nr:hypothetical protein [Mycobacterium sp.]